MIETERLVLRRPENGDAPAFAAIWSDPEVVRFLGGETWDLARAQDRIERMLWHWDWFDVGLYTVVRKDDERILGRVGFLLWDDRWVNGMHERIEPAEMEIGWTIGRDHWNQGYATEGAAACRDHAFGSLARERVVSIIARENTASIRVAEKIGERFERDIEGGFFRGPVGLYSLNAPAR